MTSFPFLTAYDPPGTSEGTLDPLGLYQIADSLAVQLVPGVRERMQRVRFLTAVAVGSLVTENIEDDPTLRDASPYLVWEWLVVEALMRQMSDDPTIHGVPGTLVAKRALGPNGPGYLDARSYLKTPRIFGFHGVYKRLAVHLGLIDVHLSPGPNAERLADAWARGFGYAGLSAARPQIDRWRTAVTRSLRERPPRTKPGWGAEEWDTLARAFAPRACGARERRCLHELLHDTGERALGAFRPLWELQPAFTDDAFSEEALHVRLKRSEPHYAPLLDAIRHYERFARGLQDAFDLLKAEAAGPDAQGFVVSTIAKDRDFLRSIEGLQPQFERAHAALGEVPRPSLSLQALFDARFRAFAERLAPVDCAQALCTHHEAVQKGKSADGKRPWFDRLGPDRIYIRHRYREERRAISPDRYVHEYRGKPIRRFRADLS
jgi:hypothetical protein